MKHYFMRSHLTITFAIMAMIPILILGSFQVSQITHITQESNQNQRQTTYRLGDAVQDYHRNAVETLAATITASDATFRTRESLTLKLQSLQENLAGFTGIYVVDQNGTIKATHNAANGTLIGADVKERDYTKRVQTAQKFQQAYLYKSAYKLSRLFG
ncbi:putative membrane metal-binding protein [Paenibacillus sp. V4I9]|uniref:hypothetical protein n=1 Tax=Paenibacillus sp. V4I9 TaxID=3042308 RepID=UPI00278B99FE|nr:hypothetical protein [Paenibacillus sp. V4I9]MDQ0891227.1 putative membrane metal-binding protein [Paenibacillus sp. V4I9]